MVLAIECDGMSVQTAQGIAQEKHPVIESYTKYHTWQCGYCTPGFIVTAKALLDKKSNPTDEEIKAALGGNLCRCGTYQQHIPAVKDAATVAAGGS
jgi:aerobic-type carbon monoxide dehydrogenase small subunit (CoxS/CutS family)